MQNNDKLNSSLFPPMCLLEEMISSSTVPLSTHERLTCPFPPHSPISSSPPLPPFPSRGAKIILQKRPCGQKRLCTVYTANDIAGFSQIACDVYSDNLLTTIFPLFAVPYICTVMLVTKNQRTKLDYS